MRTGVNGLVMGGAVLIMLGVLGFAVPHFTTEQTKDVAAVGDLKIQATEPTGHTVPSALSGAALALGVVLIGMGFYRKA